MNNEQIITKLKEHYPDARYYLDFSNPVELLVAAILSAQAKDETVNAATKELFKKYKTARDYAEANLGQLEKEIGKVSFYRNKAKNIKDACKIIVDRHDGVVPKTINELISLPGIARKTANTILINAYGIVEGIPVDTWVIKVGYRLGLTRNTNPDKIESDFMQSIAKKYWGEIAYILKAHGKAVCRSPFPYCSKCLLDKDCPKQGVTKKL